MKNVGLVLLALAVLAAPVVWHLSARYFETDDRVGELDAELDSLRREFILQSEELTALRARVDGLDSRTALKVLEDSYEAPSTDEPPPEGNIQGYYANVVLIGDRRNVNEGLTLAGSKYRRSIFGPPRASLGDDCAEMENPILRELLTLENVGPIRVRMLRPAVVSLRQVFRNVQVYEPELYSRIRSAGALCVRRIRGAQSAASAHAYGLAVDLNIDGALDTLGDGKTQLGLTILADFFNQEGWIWGAAFGREDSMHFEVSREKLEQWRRLGELPDEPWIPPPSTETAADATGEEPEFDTD